MKKEHLLEIRDILKGSKQTDEVRRAIVFVEADITAHEVDMNSALDSLLQASYVSTAGFNPAMNEIREGIAKITSAIAGV